MTLYLYQQSTDEAFRLGVRAMSRIGFTVYNSDDKSCIIGGRKQLNRNGNVIFLDVKITSKADSTCVSLFSNVFTGDSGTFIADAVSEELFIETLYDLLRIEPPGNPFRLSENDYAMAVGY